MPNSDGIIIILSYPDTIVRPAYWEKSSKIWPLIGIGSKHAVQAGHAALLLIKTADPAINYYDFGRYITSYGNGRVRSKTSDPELFVNMKATFKNEKLTNLKEILLWIELHPEKTHGNGRLIASINDEINYTLAQKFIDKLIQKKEIPYGLFIKNGTNCARFVNETIKNTTNNKKIKWQLKQSNILTPSPIGNVIKGNSTNKIYEVYNQKISIYQNRSILKEYKASFFNKFNVQPKLEGTELPDLNVFNLKNGTWLGGIGSGAWFRIEEKLDTNSYKIARYSTLGVKEFEAIFYGEKETFDLSKKHDFIHPSNCEEVFIQQNQNIFTFKIKEN